MWQVPLHGHMGYLWTDSVKAMLYGSSREGTHPPISHCSTLLPALPLCHLAPSVAPWKDGFHALLEAFYLSPEWTQVHVRCGLQTSPEAQPVVTSTGLDF